MSSIPPDTASTNIVKGDKTVKQEKKKVFFEQAAKSFKKSSDQMSLRGTI